MRKIIYIFLLILTACPWQSNKKTAEATLVDYLQDWHGTAKLQPENSVYVISPSEGYITSFGLGFGREVHKGDQLLSVSAPEIQDDFANAVIDYLRNKEKMLHANKKLKGEKELLDAGIISQEDYWGHKSESQDAFIAFIKSKVHLQEMAKLVGFDFKALDLLQVSDQKSITSLLENKVSVQVTANNDGLLLPKDMVDNSEHKDLTLGAKIDKAEIVAAIAEQGSYTVKVMIPEKFARTIAANDKVTVSSMLGASVPAIIKEFHPYLLEERSGSKFFPVLIKLIMPKPPLKIPDYYVGMPVKVALVFGKIQAIKVPMAAIGFENNKYFIDISETFSNKRVVVEVIATDVDSAYVKGDIAQGSQVYLHD